MTLDRNNSVVSLVSDGNVIPVVVDYNISQITPYVFVTAEDTARQFPMIFSNGIGCVINVANELPHIIFPPQTGIESLKYPIEDSPTFPASHYFDVVADRIAANVASNRRTLLYCHHGRSRSITFILAYLIKHHHLPLPTAFTIVKEKRQLALPNVGFWSQLKSYELYQQQQQQQNNVSPALKNLQNTVLYGHQIIHKISDGVERVLAQVPIINTITNPVYSTILNPFQRNNIRRKPGVYLNPYNRLFPSKLYHMPYF
jgi:hypothetical protein